MTDPALDQNRLDRESLGFQSDRWVAWRGTPGVTVEDFPAYVRVFDSEAEARSWSPSCCRWDDLR